MRLLIGLAGLAFAVVACGGGGGSPAPGATASPMGGTAVDIADFAYDPAAANAAVGGNVVWTNSDSVPHTVTFDEGGIDSGSMAAGATFEHTFDSAGTFEYHCTFHSNMRGTVTVGP